MWQAGSWSEIVFFILAQMAVNSSCFGISGLFVLRLSVPVNNFSVMSGRSHSFLGLTSTVDVPCTVPLVGIESRFGISDQVRYKSGCETI